jgi:hypothetical protein
MDKEERFTERRNGCRGDKEDGNKSTQKALEEQTSEYVEHFSALNPKTVSGLCTIRKA